MIFPPLFPFYILCSSKLPNYKMLFCHLSPPLSPYHSPNRKLRQTHSPWPPPPHSRPIGFVHPFPEKVLINPFLGCEGQRIRRERLDWCRCPGHPRRTEPGWIWVKGEGRVIREGEQTEKTEAQLGGERLAQVGHFAHPIAYF